VKTLLLILHKGLRFRIIVSIILVICLALLAYGYWLQFIRHLEPCPLCIFQRIAFVGMAVIALIAAGHNPLVVGRRAYALIGASCAFIGCGIAVRHVWLQSLPPDQVPECGPGLDYLMQTFPLTDALKKAFTGSGECASVDWSFLGLSMPAWALIWFLLLGFAYLFSGFRR
jgi:disulfide bond formation protein DsbB